MAGDSKAGDSTSGGIFSSFTRFFGRGQKNKSSNVTENEESTSSETGLAKKIGNQGMNGKVGKGDTKEETSGKDNATGKEPMEALYTKLQATKRGGFHLRSGNSSYYNNVTKYLGNILDIMKQSFTDKAEDNLKQFEDMQKEYLWLIYACQAYISRTALTDKGQIRKTIVQNILEAAQSDLMGLGRIQKEFSFLPPEKQAQQNWAEVMERVRVTHLSVDDLFDVKNRVGGGAAAEVIRITAGKDKSRKEDGTEESLSGTYYFKPEDEIDLTQEKHALMIIDNVMSRYPKLTPKDKEILLDWASQQTLDVIDIHFAEDPEGLSVEGRLALQTIKKKTIGTKVTHLDLMTPSGIASEGGKVNTTKRNVATSRMAALLGLEHLVAKSYTAEVFDKTTGRKVRGNLMEEAKGISGAEFYFLYRKHINNEEKADNPPPAIHNLVQRDALNLQVLDILCGQMDRHRGNIMLQADNNFAVTGIMGIDNDGSFGLNTDVVYKKKDARADLRVYDPKTRKIVLPYMDKNLAQRILALEPNMIRFTLKGLITDREIEVAVKRLKMMQEAIRNTEPEHFLEDNQWNRETAQVILERGWDSFGKLAARKKKEVQELIGKIDPDYKDVPYNKPPAGEAPYYDEAKREAESMVKDKYDNEYANTNNYFTRIILATMTKVWEYTGEKEVAPQLEVTDA